MKHFILTMIILLFLFANLNGQWEILNQGIPSSLNTIDFVNERVGWSGGSDGLLLKTEDGGQTWFSLQQNEHWSIRLIDFLDELLGWAAVNDTTNKGIILKTSDGGQTWTIQKEFIDNSISSITVVNERIVYALVNSNSSVNSKVIKTSDGGASWEVISPNNENRYFQSIQFVNSDTGFVAGTFYRTIDEDTYEDALILKTENGGKTWTEEINSELSPIEDLQCINDSTCFFKSEDLLFKTDDAFKTWPTSPLIDSTSINWFYALSMDTIYALAQGGRWWDWYPVLIKSTTGGRSWEKISIVNWGANKIYFCSPYVGFLIGGGIMFRSVDSGDHWQTQILTYPLVDVCFVDKDKGFACGGFYYGFHGSVGNIFVTYNGGKSWEINSATSYVYTCLFVNDSVGYALTKSGGVIFSGVVSLTKTTDGGKNWIVTMPSMAVPGFMRSSVLFFIDENTGWVGGRYITRDREDSTVIMSTIDGGESWEFVWKNESGVLNSIYFTNTNIGWAVGDDGLLLRTTTGKYWEEMTNPTDLPLNTVFFINEYYGFLAGGYLNPLEFQAILLKSSSGGESWDEVPDVPYLINDIYFADTQHGWLIGTDKCGRGVIIATNDGGNSWTVQEDNLIDQLQALSYRDGYLWAVGDCGLVLRTDLTTVVEDYLDQHLPSTIQLFQNYPNPFNPKTVISYQLPVLSRQSAVPNSQSAVSCWIELSIYNLLGQKVTTLVSEKQPAGKYSVEWDASDFASGVYLYRLEAGEFSETRKLIILK